MANQGGNQIAAGRIGQKRRNTIIDQLINEAKNIMKRDSLGRIIQSQQSIVPIRMPSIIDEDLSQSQSLNQRRQSIYSDNESPIAKRRRGTAAVSRLPSSSSDVSNDDRHTPDITKNLSHSPSPPLFTSSSSSPTLTQELREKRRHRKRTQAPIINDESDVSDKVEFEVQFKDDDVHEMPTIDHDVEPMKQTDNTAEINMQPKVVLHRLTNAELKAATRIQKNKISSRSQPNEPSVSNSNETRVVDMNAKQLNKVMHNRDLSLLTEYVPVSENDHRTKRIGYGMNNMGGSIDYLISTLHALFHIESFTHALTESAKSHNHLCNCDCFVCILARIRLNTSRPMPINSKANVSSPRQLVKHLHRIFDSPNFKSYEQQDAYDFLVRLVSAMKETYCDVQSRLSNWSSSLECSTISLDISASNSVNDALDVYLNQQQQQTSTRCPSLANILCLHLKRFSEDDMNNSKLCKAIEISHRLDSAKLSSSSYRLVAIVSHMGTSRNHGDYVTLVPDNSTSSSSSEGDQFYLFKCETVQLIRNSSRYKNAAYLLFYEQCSSSINATAADDGGGSSSKRTSNADNAIPSTSGAATAVDGGRGQTSGIQAADFFYKGTKKTKRGKFNAANIKYSKDEEQFTIVKKLNQFIRDDCPEKAELLRLINEYVRKISELWAIATRYTHYRLNKLVESGDDDTIREEFLAKFDARQYFYPFKDGGGGYQLEAPEFTAWLEADGIQTSFDLPNFGNPFHFAYLQFETNLTNNVKMHARRHYRKFLKRVLPTGRAANARRNQRALDATMKYLCDEESTCHPSFALLDRYYEELRPLIDTARKRRYELHHNQQGTWVIRRQHVVPRGWLNDTSITSRCYKYVYELIKMQAYIYEYNTLHPEQQIKSFNAIPQGKCKLIHIRFDAYGFMRFTNLLYEPGHPHRFETNDTANWSLNDHVEYWQRYVNLRRINKPGQQFDFGFTTNGDTAHIKMVRRKKTNAKTETKNKSKISAPGSDDEDGDDDEEEEPPAVDPFIQRAYNNHQIDELLGIDTGFRLPIAAVRRKANGGEENFTLFFKEWHRRTGFYRRKYQMHRLTGQFEVECRRLRENRDHFPESPSPKSHDYHTYLEYQLQTMREACAVKMRKCVARLSFDAYTSRQKALHWMARSVTNMAKEEPDDSRKHMVIAFGDAKFAGNSPIRGYLRCPLKLMKDTLKRYAFVVDVKEPFTSKQCSRCFRRLKRRRNVHLRQSKDRFLVCPNCQPVDAEHVLFPAPTHWTGACHRTKRHRFHQNEFVFQRFNHPLRRPRTVVVFNRDINASRNMIYKLLCLLHQRPVHRCFSHRLRRHQIIQN